MARLVKPLSPTQVQQAKPKEKGYTLSDGQGLILSIRPSGSKVWLFKYQKPYTKKRTNISFGSFPEISLAEARKLRLEALTLLAKQIDPREHKQKETQGKLAKLEHTFEKIAESWMMVKKSTVPKELKGKILHATSTQNWRAIKESGFISTTPPSLLNSNPMSHSFITSMNGICLFDFRTPNAKKCDTLFSHVPGISSQNETVWLEIEFESIKSDFWSAAQVVD